MTGSSVLLLISSCTGGNSVRWAAAMRQQHKSMRQYCRQLDTQVYNKEV